MMFHRILTAALVVAIPRSSCLEPSDLVVVVLSQHECYYANLASSLKNGIIKEAEKLDKVPPEVVLTHELSINGSWTIFPLLRWLSVNFSTSKWFFFCLESTGVSLANLVQVLSALDDREEMWVGHAIHDRAPTIIHHFADHSGRFMFPNTASGFAMTNPLLVRTSERFTSVGGPGQDFSIDAAYEFANFVFDGGKGVGLTHVSEFCLPASWDCASYPRFFDPCSEPVSRDKIFVAVKTSRQYHKDRVPIIMKTWMKHVLHYGLFSNESDESIPNIHITPHTVQGHCAKTHTILQAAHKILEEKKMDWLIIVDDDTILSMARLTHLLTCYNPSDLIGLGERYGFRVRKSTGIGYDYLTGGAGIVVSKALVKKIIETRACDCPSPTAPDDMHLFGYCLRLIGVQPVHSPAFHQARSSDYSIVYLASHECVSFHKFWMNDPYKVYNSWFAKDDDALSAPKNILHTEL